MWFILGEGKRRAFVMFAAQSLSRFLVSRSFPFVITASDTGHVWRERFAEGRHDGRADRERRGPAGRHTIPS
jgi:hypothetical protein